MAEEYNKNQIIRKDARGSFVESLDDYFSMGKAHLFFASYDMNQPPGQRQTNSIHIFIGVDELQEICRKLSSGELRWQMDQKRNANDQTPLMEWLGGTSAEKLAKYGRARDDGMSLSRTAKLLCGNKTDFLFVADSGPGEQNQKGLIVPRFGRNPENHVTVSMAWDSLSELFLLTKENYQAWLSAKYLKQMMSQGQPDGAAPNEQYPADSGYQEGYAYQDQQGNVGWNQNDHQTDGGAWYQSTQQQAGNAVQHQETSGYQQGVQPDGNYADQGGQMASSYAYPDGQQENAYQGQNLFQYQQAG